MLSHGELQLSLLLPMWRTARQSDRGIDLDYVSIFYNTFKQPVIINKSCIVVNLKQSWWLAVGTCLDTALLAYLWSVASQPLRYCLLLGAYFAVSSVS